MASSIAYPLGLKREAELLRLRDRVAVLEKENSELRASPEFKICRWLRARATLFATFGLVERSEILFEVVSGIEAGEHNDD